MPAEGAELRPARMRGFLGQVLPDYMVPAAFVVLDRLPLNPHGKLDRAALPAPDWGAVRAGRVPPRTQTERLLAEIWAGVLDIDEVGVEDNFFELGGDSILSIQLVSRAREAGLAVTSRDVFRYQTVAALAANITPTDGGEWAGGAGGRESPDLVVGPVPLTPVQRWFFQTHPHRPEHFNQTITLDLADGVDEDALRTAFAAVVAHHDALRLRFSYVDGEWRQESVPVSAGGRAGRERAVRPGGGAPAAGRAARWPDAAHHRAPPRHRRGVLGHPARRPGDRLPPGRAW